MAAWAFALFFSSGKTKPQLVFYGAPAQPVHLWNMARLRQEVSGCISFWFCSFIPVRYGEEKNDTRADKRGKGYSVFLSIATHTRALIHMHFDVISWLIFYAWSCCRICRCSALETRAVQHLVKTRVVQVVVGCDKQSQHRLTFYWLVREEELVIWFHSNIVPWFTIGFLQISSSNQEVCLLCLQSLNCLWLPSDFLLPKIFAGSSKSFTGILTKSLDYYYFY